MKLQHLISQFVLATSLVFGYTASAHARGDALTVTLYDRDDFPVHREYSRGHVTFDRHAHYPRIVKQRCYRRGHNIVTWYRTDARDHHRHDRDSHDAGIRYNQRH
jgi:hypothetical protein